MSERSTTVTLPCARCGHDRDDHTFDDEPGCRVCYQLRPDRWLATFLHEFEAEVVQG